ncbi:MAG: DUF4175 family protein [Roseiarcus sp.]
MRRRPRTPSPAKPVVRRASFGALWRGRRVLEELRGRLCDPNRPSEERDYLERLLKRD